MALIWSASRQLDLRKPLFISWCNTRWRDLVHILPQANIELRHDGQSSNVGGVHRFYTRRTEVVANERFRVHRQIRTVFTGEKTSMRHSLSALAALCFMLAPVALQMPVAHAANSVPSAVSPAEQTARVIVKYKSDSSVMRALSASNTSGPLRAPQHAAVLSGRHGIAMTDGSAVDRRAQVVFARGITSAKLAELLSKDIDVEYAEPDRVRRAQSIPNDPLYPNGQISATPAVGQWYLRPPTATNVSAINAEAAWDTTIGSSTVVVAVLDTGIRFDHPDLLGKTYPGYDFIGANVTVANDGDGRDADASDPGDWITTAEVNDPASPFYHCNTPDSGTYTGEGSTWHGTQVAGLIGAATDNGIGMASVGRNVMILPVRVLGKCIGYDSDIQAAMKWAAGISIPGVPDNTHPAKVINLSLGGSGSCGSSYQDAVNQVLAQGSTLVISAGNEGLAVTAPANCSGVIAVAGLRHAGTKVGYSSLGTEVAISAPAGNCVSTTGACLNPLLTTTNNGLTMPGTNLYSDSSNASLGTSFSAPLVSGTVGLMLSANPALTTAQIRAGLQNSARPFPTSSDTTSTLCHAPNSTEQDECVCTTSTCGAGMLDAAGAVAAAVSLRATPAPTVLVSSSAVDTTIGASVTLDGSGTLPPAGRTIANYSWTVESGSSPASFSGVTTNPTATLVTSAPGMVVVKLTVTDSVGSTSFATISINVGAPPTAAFSPPSSSTTFTAGVTVPLDASASTATSGRTIVAYQWSITSGASIGSLTSSSGQTVSLTTTAAGSITVSLTVTDSAGAVASTNSTFTVGAAPTSSGGGGGALDLGWLVAMMAAVVAVFSSRRHQA